MKQHKWYRQIVIVIGLSLLLVGCGSNSVCVNGKMYYAVYFFGGWGMFIWFMFALAICAAGG